ncbi:EAL domain-containing protein [Pseudomonas kitaguniensis]|uniref:EAL domain-containing protein n=1 Tax=Pseudomonas kitaguniensis TaxID=2607908 RepID=UPI003CFFF388
MINTQNEQPSRHNRQQFKMEEISNALKRAEFKAYYQPKVELFGLDLSGVEVLARWEHPLFGVLTPDRFLPSVIECGLLNEMTHFLLAQALSVQKRLSDMSIRTTMAINIEPSQVADNDFVCALIAQANFKTLATNELTIEITERNIDFSWLPKFLKNTAKLKAAGFNLSIDDFGTGYSSLERICKTPCSEIKIDRTLVRNMISDNRHLKIIQIIVNIGRTLKLNVVAEGIETIQQLNLLQSLGCHQGQGHLFSNALSSEQIEQWCIKWAGCIS